jgi:cbb3-type cytochrome oxidase subunit 3
MKQEGLKYFTDTHMVGLGLILFFVCFIGFVIWSFRKGSSEIYQQMENLPLKDEG